MTLACVADLVRHKAEVQALELIAIVFSVKSALIAGIAFCWSRLEPFADRSQLLFIRHGRAPIFTVPEHGVEDR